MELLDALSFIVNPWELSLPAWVLAVIVKEIALQGMDMVVHFLVEGTKQLPSRLNGRKVPQRPLGMDDWCYLGMNSIIECLFTLHLLHTSWYNDSVTRPLGQFGLLNGPVALWLLIMTDDMFYAPTHRALHMPFLYKWIHKHHHRVAYPQRGNIDARNEHPVEQLLGMACWWAAFYLVQCTTGIHAVIIPLHLGMMVVFQCLNHTDSDFSCKALGIEFSVRAHEMHHRKLDCNYGQFVMCWDRLMGSYLPYMAS